jgi:hypothetical protein
MDELLGPLLRGKPPLDLAVLLALVALAPPDGIGLEGFERLGDVADLVGARRMRDDAVHVPLGEAQDDAVEVGERLGDDAPEHIADARGERRGDDHGEQRR